MIYSKITSLAVALFLALEVTVAHPHGKIQHRRSPKAEAIAEPEPEPVAEAIAEAFAEPEPEPEVYTEYVTVYVDQNGNIIENYPGDQSAPQAAEAPKTVDISTLATTNTASKGVASVSGSKPGIVYSPYTSTGGCKSASQVASDISKISTFGLIRLYGIDCDQVKNVLAAVGTTGPKLFVGIYNVGSYSSEVATLISTVGSNWSMIHTVAIGNELVNSGSMTATAVVTALNSARTLLRAAGYTGPVVTVDTWVAIMANPVLCENSDYIAANCHPYFDGGVSASGAGDFLTVQGANVKKTCPGKDLLITETGWPHQGNSNGLALVSTADQTTALKSIRTAMGSDFIAFTYEDDLWKTDNAATGNAEKYWGIQDYTVFN